MKKRKRQIIQAARTLFIAKGFANTSILDIITAANISKGTFYNHFSSKNECLIAIIEENREDVVNQRYEVALHEDPSNIDILVKQMSILLQVNRKKDLVQILESYSRYSDVEIRKVFENHLILETDWLANRFVDVYGENIRDLAYDCAVFAIGMLQHSIKMIILAMGKIEEPEVVIRTVLQHIFKIIPSIQTEQQLMTEHIVQTLQNKIENKSISKVELIRQLEGFVDKLSTNDPENGVELANFLLIELQSSQEKIYVLQSILSSFNKAFEHTVHNAEAHEISITFWEYLHKQN